MLGDRYRLVRRIATGGMGAVYEGVDERLGRRVAVKVLKEEYGDDPRFVERFSREARAAATLSHHNIVQVLDSGHDGEQHFIVMEFVEGRNLDQVLTEGVRLTPQEAVSAAAQLCAALAAAHSAGIIHRDIKPGNVLVQPDGQIKVTDFGIAQIMGQASLTGTGTVLGTAHYLSPEQASGQGATPASDLYAVGVLLYQALTGTVPFAGDSPVAVALSHIRNEVPPVHDLAPDVPAALAAVVARATAKDPRHRYADAAQMQIALDNALAASPSPGTATAPLPTHPAATDRPSGLVGRLAAAPRPWLLAAIVTVLVGAVAAVWVGLSGGPSSPQDDHGPAAGSHPPQTQPSKHRTGPSTPTSSPSRSPQSTVRGPVVPADALGSDVHDVEDRLSALGYHVQKVEIASVASKDTVLATFPSPGHALTPEQTVLLITSQGHPPSETTQYLIPDGIVGSYFRDAEQLLKDQHLDVKKVDVDSARPKDTVVATYPAPGDIAITGTVVLAVSGG